VIRGATNKVTATIGVGSLPQAVAVDPSTHTAYVANYGDSTVSVINEATNTVTATLTGFNSPDGVAVDPTTDTAYVNSAGLLTSSDGMWQGFGVSEIWYNPPSSYPSGYHQLFAENSNLCVGLYSAPWPAGINLNNNSDPVDQYPCGGLAPASQEWRLNPVSGGYGELQNQYSGKDLVVANASTAAGAKIIQYDQNGTTNGLWKPIALGSGVWQFQNENSGQCLDVTGGSTSGGVQLDQQPCQSNPWVQFNQVFVTR
jgi:YVTN family beta-propeller protein